MTVRPKHGFDIAFRRFIDFHALNASCFHVRFFRARFFVNLLLIYSNHAFLSQCFFMRFLAVVLPLLRWNFTLKIYFSFKYQMSHNEIKHIISRTSSPTRPRSLTWGVRGRSRPGSVLARWRRRRRRRVVPRPGILTTRSCGSSNCSGSRRSYLSVMCELR